MLRDLATVIEDLHQGLLSAIDVPHEHFRLNQAEILLPVDMRIIFRDEGAVLQGDVQRVRDDINWRHGISRLQVEWQTMATEEVIL